MDNLRLGFQMTEKGDVTLALAEAGSGVQSGVLLALHRLEQKAADNPEVQYILAVEEPEYFSIRSGKKNSTKIFYQRRLRICVSS